MSEGGTGDISGSLGRRRGSGGVIDQVELLTIAQGFVASSVLFALMRLDIFGAIGDGEMSALELASMHGADNGRLARILDVGVMHGLLARSDANKYSVPLGLQSMVLDATAPGYLGNWLSFLESWYAPFGALDDMSFGSTTVGMYETDDGTIRRNTLAMHDFASLRGKEIVEFLDLSECLSLLDVGCGPGTYSFELGARNPQMSLDLLDQPVVLEVAREIAKGYALSNAIRFIPTDLQADRLTGEYDAVLVSNVLQAFEPAVAEGLLKKIFDVIAPGGSVIVQAQFLADDRRGPRWPSYVDLACLCFTDGGQNHTVSETIAWLRNAGFSDIDHHPMSLLNANSFVRGFKR